VADSIELPRPGSAAGGGGGSDEVQIAGTRAGKDAIQVARRQAILAREQRSQNAAVFVEYREIAILEQVRFGDGLLFASHAAAAHGAAQDDVGRTMAVVGSMVAVLAQGAAEFAQYNGIIYNDSSVTIAQVTDGTSNTLLFGEHSRFSMQKAGSSYVNSDFSWNSGRFYDTLFMTFYPPNPPTTSSYSYYYGEAASSQHPGGANFALADGSVRFIKNTINSWTISGANQSSYKDYYPDGVTSSNYIWSYGTAVLGVYQKLSTRNGGEVLSSDSY